AGAALMRDPAAVEGAVRAVAAAAGVPVTVKIRAGWDETSVNCVEVARAAEQGGAGAVALHGRTRAQMYSGQARWDLVGAVKQAVGVPVLGSGDVWTAADALRMRRETGCDAVLVARGACGNPWIFRELRALERGEPAPAPPGREEWASLVLRHIQMQIEHRRRQPRWADLPEEAELQAVRELRRHLLWYTRGRRGGVRFRREATSAGTLAEVRELLERHFADGASFELDPSLLAADPIAG
ncbi:MAG TPA: tRNA-dihydrouridine synthase, partial [Anaeromyxobacteraceae bacterium]|nr:tRNA-dihydrouridine synthase [Anaeromyxobacteraceae bacterium]